MSDDHAYVARALHVCEVEDDRPKCPGVLATDPTEHLPHHDLMVWVILEYRTTSLTIAGRQVSSIKYTPAQQYRQTIGETSYYAWTSPSPVFYLNRAAKHETEGKAG